MQNAQIKTFFAAITAIEKIAARQRGAAMPEYGLLVALIAVFLIAATTVLRDGIAAVFNAAGAALQAAAN